MKCYCGNQVNNIHIKASSCNLDENTKCSSNIGCYYEFNIGHGNVSFQILIEIIHGCATHSDWLLLV